MALRWLKPLEQGFDVKLTAGTHGGCMRLLAAADGPVTDLVSLKGKTIATGDMASPAKNFFSIMLAKLQHMAIDFLNAMQAAHVSFLPDGVLDEILRREGRGGRHPG